MKVEFINRSRHVGQSYFSSIFTTLWAFFTVIPLVYRLRPKLVIMLFMMKIKSKNSNEFV